MLGRGVLSTARAHVLHRHGEVDPVGSAPDMVVDPVQLDLQPFGLVGESAEDAEAAGVGHRRHHVPAVAEGEDRKLDAESVADRRTHGDLPRDGLRHDCTARGCPGFGDGRLEAVAALGAVDGIGPKAGAQRAGLYRLAGRFGPDGQDAKVRRSS